MNDEEKKEGLEIIEEDAFEPEISDEELETAMENLPMLYTGSDAVLGSKNVGRASGLAAAALDFTNIEEDPDRSRIIIFSTDNDLQGDEIITLPEAGQLCVDRGITVYGIGTEQMYPSDKAMMRDAVEMTGGEFYYGEDSRVVSNIIDNIQEHVASLDTIEYEISETVTPEIPFIILLISMACMILLQWLCKV